MKRIGRRVALAVRKGPNSFPNEAQPASKSRSRASCPESVSRREPSCRRFRAFISVRPALATRTAKRTQVQRTIWGDEHQLIRLGTIPLLPSARLRQPCMPAASATARPRRPTRTVQPPVAAGWPTRCGEPPDVGASSRAGFKTLVHRLGQQISHTARREGKKPFSWPSSASSR